VSKVPGVCSVINELEIHDTPENIPSLQGGRQRSEASHMWTPTARLIGGVVGGGLAAYGLRSSNRVGKATTLAGVGLLTRAITNQDVRSLADWDRIRRMTGRGVSA
jgi:uncharacterized membrane protein